MGLKARTSPGPWVILVLGLFLAPTSGSKAQVLTEQQAKAAVHRIVQHSGLLPNFEVRENRSIPTAIAFIKNRKRYIEYNPAFMVRLMDSTRTDHAAISILAHEVAHHLLGHTLDPGQLHPGDELACDRYSGFILRSMGADLPTTLAAMAIAGDPHGTERHPPRHARLAAIEQGWESHGQTFPDVLPPPVDLQFSVRFEGDENTYYVDGTDQVIWFNHLAEPIAFGRFGPSTQRGYEHELTWSGLQFQVDKAGLIWRRTAHDMSMRVGRLEVFRTP